MYELTCPYCQKDDTYMEYDGHFGEYCPCECPHCKKVFYVYHQSCFNPMYDTTNVEVRTKEELDQMVQDGKVKKSK